MKFEGVLQLRLGIGEAVALDERFERRPTGRVEQRAEDIAIHVDELGGAGV